MGITAAVIIAGAVGASATAYGASETAGATENASNLQSDTAQKTIDFQKQQAEALYGQQEQAAQANYQQWAAQQSQMNAVRQMLGLPQEDIPAFSPIPDPNITGTNPSPSPAGMTTQQAQNAPPTLPSTPNNAQSPQATPPSGAPQTGKANFGGGWDQATQNPAAAGLQKLLASGLSGQAAVDQLNQNPATAGISYNPSNGTYGIPGGYYVAPNAAQGGALDLIKRADAVAAGVRPTVPSIGTALNGQPQTFPTGPQPLPQAQAVAGPYQQQPYVAPASIDQYLKNPYQGGIGGTA